MIRVMMFSYSKQTKICGVAEASELATGFGRMNGDPNNPLATLLTMTVNGDTLYVHLDPSWGDVSNEVVREAYENGRVDLTRYQQLKLKP